MKNNFTISYTNKKEGHGVNIQNVVNPTNLDIGAIFDFFKNLDLKEATYIRISDRFGNVARFERTDLIKTKDKE